MKKQILLLIFLGFMVFSIFYFLNFYPLICDSWMHMGVGKEATEIGVLKYTNYGYPTKGAGSLIASLSVVSGIKVGYFLLIFIQIFAGVFVTILVYSLLKKYNEKIALLAAIFTIFGFGGQYFVYRAHIPHFLDFFFLPFLLYLNYKFIETKEYFWPHLMIFMALLLTHVWPVLIYMIFYFLFLCMFFINGEDRKIKKKVFINFLIMGIWSLFCFKFFNWSRYLNIDMKIFYISPFIILFMLFLISINKFSMIIKNFFNCLKEKIIEKKKKLAFLIPLILVFTGFSIIFLKVITQTYSQNWIGSLSTIFSFSLFFALMLVGLIEMLAISDKKVNALIFLITFWCSVSLLFFVTGTMLMKYPSLLPDRHWAYVVILGSIPAAFAFKPLIKRKNNKLLVFCLICIVLVSVINQSYLKNQYLRSDDPQELNMFNWINQNTPIESTILSDYRIMYGLFGASERKTFLTILSERNLNVLSQINYTIWSDQFFKQKINLGYTQENAKINDKLFFNNRLFDKVYSTQNASLFKKISKNIEN